MRLQGNVASEKFIDCTLRGREFLGSGIPPNFHNSRLPGRQPANFARRLGRVEPIFPAEHEQRVIDPRRNSSLVTENTKSSRDGPNMF